MKLTPSGKIVFWGCLWGFGVLILAVLLDPTPENFTLGVSIFLSGLYTWLLYLTQECWIKRLRRKPMRNAILLGSLNAAVIEILFLVVEKAFGAAGVAAHPNLLVDLLLTMPWYIGIVWIFVKIQSRQPYPNSMVLLLGALYELGGDGIIGGILLPSLMGAPPDLLEFLILIPLAVFWQFIPVYSSIVLAPAWVLRAGLDVDRPDNPRVRAGFLPLLWMAPYLAYIISALLAIDSWGL